MTTTDAPDILKTIEDMRGVIEAHRDEGDRIRRLPDAIGAAIVERDLYRMLLPRDLGGAEMDVVTFFRAVEAVSAMDASSGWNLGIAAGAAVYAGYVPRDVAREYYGTPESCIAAMLNPVGGRAVATEGGYRISGRWAWGSTVHQSNAALFGCLVFDGDELRRTSEGGPVMRHVLIPRAEYDVLDTWYTGGMRGTGSTDCEVRDCFVPDERAMLVFFSKRYHDAPLFRLPATFFGPSLSMVTFGIARMAIDTVVELAGAKMPMGSRSLLRDRTSVQEDVATAEAMVGSARGYLFEAIEEMWELAVAGDPVEMPLRAKVRRASVHAGRSSRTAVDLMYALAGGTAVYERSPLERAHRDVHVAMTHVVASRGIMEDAGRVQLGLPPLSFIF